MKLSDLFNWLLKRMFDCSFPDIEDVEEVEDDEDVYSRRDGHA